MVPPPRTPTQPAARVRQYSWCKHVKKEVCLYIRTLKPLKSKKEERKLKFKHPGSTNCDVIVSDVIVTEPNSDAIMRDVNKPIVRKRYAQKHSLVSKKGFLKSSLIMYSQTFTKVALVLAVVIRILGGVLTVKLPERISTIGTSSSLSSSSVLAKPRSTTLYHSYSALGANVDRERFGGKTFRYVYIPIRGLLASRDYYLDTYTVNLESDYNFAVFYNLRYIYIYIYFLPFVVTL